MPVGELGEDLINPIDNEVNKVNPVDRIFYASRHDLEKALAPLTQVPRARLNVRGDNVDRAGGQSSRFQVKQDVHLLSGIGGDRCLARLDVESVRYVQRYGERVRMRRMIEDPHDQIDRGARLDLLSVRVNAGPLLVDAVVGRIPREQVAQQLGASLEDRFHVLQLAGIETGIPFDGRSLMQLVRRDVPSFESSFYITECTWMRKHGWRTPEWKLIHALEPDFHFKPEVELYNLVDDPAENRNVAKSHRDVVACMESQMRAHIRRREKETGLKNQMFSQPHWHGKQDAPAYFRSSREAYTALHIGNATAARKLQAKGK